ncbi:diguanylate cyclase [Candidatus Acetothermia bacterium]|nr:diguanylate cyclase [Candidatus Acetothermia bacterium]
MAESTNRIEKIYSGALLLSGTPLEIFDEIVRWVCEILKVEIAIVERFEEEKIKVISRLHNKKVFHEGESPLKGSPCEQVKRKKKSCLFNQAAKKFPEANFVQKHSISFYAGIPLFDQAGEVMGLLVAMSKDEREVSSDELSLMELLSRRAAMELEHQRESEESYRLRHQLLEIGREILQHQNTREVLQRVARSIREHSPFNLVAISLFESPIDPVKKQDERIKKVVIAGLSPEEEKMLQDLAKTGEIVPAWQILEKSTPVGGGYYVNPEMIPEIVPKGVKGKKIARGPAAWGPYDDFYFFLWQGDQIIGRISLGDPNHGRIPNASELEPLNLFATLASLALDRAGQMEKVSEFQRRLHGIYEWSKQLADVDRFDSLVQEVLQMVIKNFAYDHVTLFASEGQGLSLVGFETRLPLGEFEMENFKHLKLDQGIVGRAAQRRKPVLVRDVHKDPDYIIGHSAIRSELAVPIAAESEVLGVLNIESTRVNAFNKDDVELLNALARQLAIVIKGLQHRRELQWVNDFLQGLNQASDLKDTLDIIIRQGMEIVDPKADGGVFLILDEERKVFQYAAAVNRDLELLQQFSYPEDEIRRVYPTLEEPLIINRSSHLERYDFSQLEEDMGTQYPASSISLPIQVSGRLIAICNISNEKAEGAFSDQDAKKVWKLVVESKLALTRARDHERLKEMATHDALTNTFNRHYFTQFINEEGKRATQQGKPISLVMVDIDNFFHVNDKFGHTEGDRILQVVAGMLANVVRKPDTVVRYGGDEFVIIMPGTSHGDAERVMERLRVKFEEWQPDLPSLKLSISFGVASWDPAGDESLEEVLERADQFMYHRRQSRLDEKALRRQAKIEVPKAVKGP